MLSSSRPLSNGNGYTYHRDIEKGMGTSSSKPSAIARRCLPTKKGRWAIIIIFGLVTMYHFSGVSEPEPSYERGRRKPGHKHGASVEGVLDEHVRAHPDEPPRNGWGRYFELPFGRGPRHGSPVKEVDEGPRIGSGGVPPTQQDQSQFHFPVDKPTDPLQLLAWIEPMHPDLSELPLPSELFPEVTLPDYFKPPPSDPYPSSQLRDIISPPPPNSHVQTPWSAPKKSFRNEWIAPEQWDDPKKLRRLQWDGFAGGRDRWEHGSERRVREERREAVKRGFAYGWQAYKDRAWGHDEVKPVSGTVSDPFNGWGASIVDTLGTMLIMGLSDEYNLCRPHVNQLNFHWNNGRDSHQGYISDPSTRDDTAETWSVPRDRMTNLAVFETSIRYLGGLLSAYDLSGDAMILERCVELADILSKAFNTESGLPVGRLDPGAEGDHHMSSISIAEAGSMSVDFIRLSQVTGDRKYYDLAQRAMDYLEIRVIPRSVIKPLIPLSFQPDAGLNNQMNGIFSWGGMGDSYYEYLIKTYKLLGGSEVAQQWRKLYEQSVDVAKKNLYEDVEYIPDHPILAIGKIEHGRYKPEIEHLTCFAGGMLGMGAKLLDRPDDMADAEKFTSSCYWVSQNSPLGLQAEHVVFHQEDKEEVWEDVDASGTRYHPWVDPRSIKEGAELDRMHQDREGVWRWNTDQKPVLEADGGAKRDETPETVKRLRGVMPGIKAAGGRYINRPETVESLYYMYRLTGDRKWQEKGWKMYVSWMTTSKVERGFSSVNDVTKDVPTYGDNMESFAFAELFKYHYLLQSDPDLISLDDYVFNTEAHPFLANRDIAPGSQRFWTPPPDPSANLGVRGEGTDAQKWTRQRVLWRGRESQVGIQPRGAVPHQGGGKGMGGGGGYPGYIPPLPPGFGG